MDFDPLARRYHRLERLAFGGALQRCRVALIDHTRDAANVLILGEGDGRFLNEFLQVNPTAKVTVVDSSGEMIRIARQRIGSNDRVEFVQADVRNIDLSDESYDLVVTHFFLDCFDESDVETIVENVSKKLTNKGRWLWSDFAIPQTGITRPIARLCVGILYWFFRRTTHLEARALVDPSSKFRKLRFESVEEKSSLNGLLKSVLWRK